VYSSIHRSDEKFCSALQRIVHYGVEEALRYWHQRADIRGSNPVTRKLVDEERMRSIQQFILVGIRGGTGGHPATSFAPIPI